jgi:dTDP-4-amino-4,6-dideoxygalactose transaminase
MFYVILPSLADRQSLLTHLRERGIVAAFHYVPLNTTPMASRFGAEPGMCPVAEAMSDRLLRLPFYNSLSIADQDLVIDAMRHWRE